MRDPVRTPRGRLPTPVGPEQPLVIRARRRALPLRVSHLVETPVLCWTCANPAGVLCCQEIQACQHCASSPAVSTPGALIVCASFTPRLGTSYTVSPPIRVPSSSQMRRMSHRPVSRLYRERAGALSAMTVTIPETPRLFRRLIPAERGGHVNAAAADSPSLLQRCALLIGQVFDSNVTAEASTHDREHTRQTEHCRERATSFSAPACSTLRGTSLLRCRSALRVLYRTTVYSWATKSASCIKGADMLCWRISARCSGPAQSGVTEPTLRG